MHGRFDVGEQTMGLDSAAGGVSFFFPSCTDGVDGYQHVDLSGEGPDTGAAVVGDQGGYQAQCRLT